MTGLNNIAPPLSPAEQAGIDRLRAAVDAHRIPRWAVHLRAVTAVAGLTWAAVYVVLAVLVRWHLSLVDCLGLSTAVAWVVGGVTGACVLVAGEPFLDPNLGVVGSRRRLTAPVALRVVLAALLLAVVAVTVWRLM